MKTYKTYIDNIRLVKEKSEIKKVGITCSNDIAEYVRQFYFDDLVIYESLFLVLLNRNNTTIGWVKISQGGTTFFNES